MNQAATFFYETEVEWKGERAGKLAGVGLPSVSVGAPPEFNGREGNWSPEQLLVASVNTCYMLTLIAIAENSKIGLVSLISSAKGKLEKVQGAGYQITEITIKPKVVVASPKDVERVSRIVEKAKQNCFVSNSIKSSITVEPEIFHQQTPATPCPLGESPDASGSSPRGKPS
ncbi:MAG TPA: OsmC family protein [Candidatus Binatia bacterium]